MTEPTMTKADAELLWQAITEQMIAQAENAAIDLLKQSLRAPSTNARTVAANIRRDGYTMRDHTGQPDRDYACKLLADELVDGNALNARWTVNDRGASMDAYRAAKLRQDSRAAIKAALVNLTDDGWRALIDRIADAADARAA